MKFKKVIKSLDIFSLKAFFYCNGEFEIESILGGLLSTSLVGYATYVIFY